MIKSAGKTHKPTGTSLKLLLAVMTVQVLSACSENDMSDLSKFIVDTRSKYAGQVEPLPVITPYESYTYILQEQRDPFKASVALVKEAPRTRSNNGIKPNEVRNKEELEKYDLNSLVMVGILNNDGQNWAIIKAPDNSIFKVRKGNYMGENHGQIIKISESGIDLKEIVPDGMGGWIERKNKLALTE